MEYSPQEESKHTLDRLFCLAKAACADIETFRPDLVLVLAHGGWGALWAALALWEETRSQSFPPVLVVNLGREKLKRYEKIRDSIPCTEHNRFIPDYAGNFEVGYFLAWLAEQKDWQQQLRQMVLEANGQAVPQRILVLDDTTWEGGTYRLALGLLREALPECQAHMVAGFVLNWRGSFLQLWEQEHGVTKERLRKHEGDEEKEETSLGRLIYYLAPGTEDLTEDVKDENSLAWKPITASSKLICRLSAVLPAETWLELPVWAQAAIREGVVERARLEEQGKVEVRCSDDVLPRPQLKPAELVIQYLWQHGTVTRRQAAGLLGISPARAGRVLARMLEKRDLLKQGKNRGAAYVLPPNATLPKEQRPAWPLLDAYWVAERRLMAGHWSFEPDVDDTVNARIDWITGQGITWVLDVNNICCGSDGSGEEEKYQAYARQRGLSLEYREINFSGAFYITEKKMRAIIAAVKEALAAGHNVYLRVLNPDATAAAAACLLVEMGYDSATALQEIDRWARSQYEPWFPVPSYRRHRALVKKWRPAGGILFPENK